VREHFDLDRMNLLGISWGSALVTLYAAEYPDRIGRLILLPMRARRDPDVPEGASQPPVVLDEEVKARLAELRATWETAADPVEVCEQYWSILAPLLLHEPDRMRGDFCDEPAEVLRYTWNALLGR
jgi:pimeloyl-ACP methyl ester carboxylesterase